MSDSGATHFDAAESGAICHDACAVAEIRRLRTERDALRAALRELVDLSGITDDSLGVTARVYKLLNNP